MMVFLVSICLISEPSLPPTSLANRYAIRYEMRRNEASEVTQFAGISGPEPEPQALAPPARPPASSHMVKSEL